MPQSNKRKSQCLSSFWTFSSSSTWYIKMKADWQKGISIKASTSTKPKAFQWSYGWTLLQEINCFSGRDYFFRARESPEFVCCIFPKLNQRLKQQADVNVVLFSTLGKKTHVWTDNQRSICNWFTRMHL